MQRMALPQYITYLVNCFAIYKIDNDALDDVTKQGRKISI